MDTTPILVPYKSVGVYLDSVPPFIFQINKKEYLLVSTIHSFKLMKLPSLKIKLMGPHFANRIRAVSAVNERIYVATKNIIHRLHYYHIEKSYISSFDDKINCILNFGNKLISGDQQGALQVFDEKTAENLLIHQFGWSIKKIIHPNTYLNKILVAGSHNLILFNIMTGSIIYDLSSCLSSLSSTVPSPSLTDILPTPSLHVIALALSNGDVLLHNIQTDTPIMSFKTQNPIINISFSIDGEPLLAAGDCEGFVWIWNLNDRKLISDKKHFPYPISLLSFISSSSLLIGCSSSSTLILLTIDSSSLHSLREIRKRQGLLGTVQKLRFAGNLDSLVVVGADGEGEEGSMREVCIFNENASLNYSVKENKEVEKKGWKTESNSRIGPIIKIDIAKVETDWANILTAHRFSAKPCFWSRQNRSIVKKTAELVPPSSLPPLPSSQLPSSNNTDPVSSSQHQQLLDGLAYITAVSVSGCGNFGSFGYSNGYILQINIQSGLFQKNFSFHKQEIIGITSDSYNKVMISGDTDGWVVFFDFFSGEVLKAVKMDSSVVDLQIGTNGSLAAIALSNYDIEIWHISMRNRARKLQGHQAAITEIKFSNCNRFLFSSSLDKTIKVWDILSGNIITNLLLPKAIQTFDVSPDGELLASSFYSSSEICLWHCRTATQPYGSSKEISLRFSSFFQEKKPLLSEDQDQKDEKSSANGKITNLKGQLAKEDELTHNLSNVEEGITFTGRKEGAWLPLLYWDELKERNRAEITEKKEIKVPFFLDFSDKSAKMREQIESEKFEEEKSKLLAEEKEKNLEKMGSGFEKVLLGDIGREEAEKMLKELNNMTPASVEYEFRRVALGKLDNIGKMLRIFGFWLDDRREIDLKNVYLASFLKITYDKIMLSKEFIDQTNSLHKKLHSVWTELEFQMEAVLQMVDLFGRIKS